MKFSFFLFVFDLSFPVPYLFRLVTVEMGWPQSGIGAEVLARVMESKSFVHFAVFLIYNVCVCVTSLNGSQV